MSWDLEAVSAADPLACQTISCACIFGVAELRLSWLWSVSHDLACPAFPWYLGQTRDPAGGICIEHTNVTATGLSRSDLRLSILCIWVNCPVPIPRAALRVAIELRHFLRLGVGNQGGYGGGYFASGLGFTDSQIT